ncbi:hypothetical protein [Hyphomonas sp.]|uniref:hypothetical protein n=1 Tax=Hyphomonas sp. TaxID=87 RepID=UPI00349FF72E
MRAQAGVRLLRGRRLATPRTIPQQISPSWYLCSAFDRLRALNSKLLNTFLCYFSRS